MSLPRSLYATKAIRDPIQNALASMPESTERERYEKDKQDLDVRIKVLEKRNRQYGVEDLILKEVDYNCEENNDGAFPSAIDAVEARKAEL